MKIVEPSFEVIEDQLEKLTIPERIEQCGRICYKSEGRITPDSAIPFCKKMVESGHGAVLEMATVHLVVNLDMVDLPESKYISVDFTEDEECIISGSIRGFLEVEGLSMNIEGFLADEHPVFFSSDVARGWESQGVRFATQEEIPASHRHVAVKFIVNRAVSHELVRHRPCSFLQESQRYCRYEDEVVFIRPEWWDKGKQSLIGSCEYDWESHMSACENRYREFLARGKTPQQARAVLPNSTKTEVIVYADLPEWKHIFSLRDHPAADPEMRRVMAPLHQEFKRRWPDFF